MNNNPYFDQNQKNDRQYTPFAPENVGASSNFVPKNPYIDQNGSYGDFDRPAGYVQIPATSANKNTELRKKAVRTLGFGITALITSHIWVCSFFGIIFGAIAMSGAKRLLALQNVPSRPAVVVGRVLGRIGFILGIVITSLVLLILSSGTLM